MKEQDKIKLCIDCKFYRPNDGIFYTEINGCMSEEHICIKHETRVIDPVDGTVGWDNIYPCREERAKDIRVLRGGYGRAACGSKGYYWEKGLHFKRKIT